MRHYRNGKRFLKVVVLSNIVLVYGMGISAKAAAATLARLGYTVAIYDDKNDYSDGFYGCLDRRGFSLDKALDGVKMVVVSPSVPLNSPLLNLARKNDIEILGEVELAYRYCKSDVVAITGTNGKTTTTMMISKLLSDCQIPNYAIGNIGVPFCTKALDMSADEVAVLEISSYQLESTEYFRPKIGICLNVTPDHLERHKSFDEYIRVKRSIFDNSTSEDFAILNADDDICFSFGDKITADTYYFSVQKEVRGVFCDDGIVYFKNLHRTKICDVSALEKTGHNLANALACLAVAKILNIPDSLSVKSIAAFKPPRHRLELVGKVCGANVYNDSKATNTASTIKACEAMYGSVCLIAGGYDKGLDTDELFLSLPKSVKAVVCFGANKKKLMQSAIKTGCFAVTANNLNDAVDKALSQEAANVLFSPATSSYDMFKDFEERGDAFVRLVKEKICAKES